MRQVIQPVGTRPSFVSLKEAALKAGLIDEGDVSFILLDDQRAVGICSASKEGGTVHLSLFFEESCSIETRRRLIMVIDQKLERICRPDFILCETESQKSREALKGCLYFKSGRKLKRPAEDWRKQLPQSCFDDAGYLINQGAMKDLPYGWFSTVEKGCGWIAVYNLMKWYGKEPFLKETAEGLAEHAILGEVGGENIANMYQYLRKHQIPVQMRPGISRTLIPLMQKSRAGILLYNHPHGSHYAAYEKIDAEHFHFFNAVYGRREDVLSLSDFYRTRVMIPAGTVLYLK